MRRPKVLTPDAAGRELAKVLRLAAQKDEQLRDLVKERKGEIAALHKRARELQGIVLGDAQQLVAGEPAHAPDGSRCPKNGIDWRGCATCSVQVASGRRPLPALELPLKGGAA